MLRRSAGIGGGYWRRWRMVMAAAAMLGQMTAASLASAAGTRSGMAWQSGAACPAPGFEAWRGRPIDMLVGYAPWDTWDNMVGWARKGTAHWLARGGAKVSVGLGLLTAESRGQFHRCVAGVFDQRFRDVGSALNAKGSGDIHIRLGWEANGSETFPWFIGDRADSGRITAYKRCFQHAVKALRSTAPGLKIDWEMAKKGKLPVAVTEAYPGDAWVDDIAISYYDRYAFNTTQEIWDKQLRATIRGGPWGIGAWLDFARSRGKPLSVPEWGVNDGFNGLGTDNPVYVRNMHAFFAANAASIGYESYFNCDNLSPGTYGIYPEVANPLAAAAYRSLWRPAAPPVR